MKANFEELERKGYTILNQILSNEYVEEIIQPLEDAFSTHRAFQQKNNVEISSNGVALHILASNPELIDVLDELNRLGIIEGLTSNYFKGNCILNSMSALSTLPNTNNFATFVHRDIRIYVPTMNIMLNMLIMLDDFTEENGATLLLPYSHLVEAKPSDEFFHANAIKANGKKGSILLFNSNIWHAAGINSTNQQRRAMPLTFSKPFLKQQMDYCRVFGYQNVEKMNEQKRQLLGFNSRVPSDLNEWYTPADKRFYKKDQDQ